MFKGIRSRAHSQVGSLTSSSILQFALVIILLGSGFTLARRYDVEFALNRSPHELDPESEYIPRYRRENGPQLVMAYVGSSTCGWSNTPGLPHAVESIKLQLAKYAKERGWSFKAVGVALDWSPELGFEHLTKFGRFDEISAGYNWGNTFAARYLWSDDTTEPMTPQVLVYKRFYVAPKDSTDELYFGERDRLLLVTKPGRQAIVEWADSGAVLPEGR